MSRFVSPICVICCWHIVLPLLRQRSMHRLVMRQHGEHILMPCRRSVLGRRMPLPVQHLCCSRLQQAAHAGQACVSARQVQRCVPPAVACIWVSTHAQHLGQQPGVPLAGQRQQRVPRQVAERFALQTLCKHHRALTPVRQGRHICLGRLRLRRRATLVAWWACWLLLCLTLWLLLLLLGLGLLGLLRKRLCCRVVALKLSAVGTCRCRFAAGLGPCIPASVPAGSSGPRLLPPLLTCL